jgi:hypothetical protein
MAGRFKLRVQQPCSEPWGSMAGDDRRRFCGRCSLHVHDLSVMSEGAVMKLIAGPDPHLCIRYNVRDDGTAVIGESRVGRWLRVAGLTALGAFFWATVVLVQLPWLAIARKLSPAPSAPNAQAEARAREERARELRAKEDAARAKLETRLETVRAAASYRDVQGGMFKPSRELLRNGLQHRKHAKRK